MFSRIRQGFQVRVARLAVRLLKASGVFDGYFAPWRWAVYDYAERRGLHILPVHYYTPIPDLRGQGAPVRDRRYLAAPEAVLDEGLALLASLRTDYRHAFDEIARRSGEPGRPVTRFELGRAPYSTVEAEALYGLIRRRQPKRIVEVGCGHTTFLIAEAVRDAAAAGGYAPRYTCIEPFRPAYLADPPKEVSEFIERPLQDVPLDFFGSMEPGDILFIDSSHVVKYDSDTVYELLEILPRLRPGVLVHLHDIFLPYEYPWDWLAQSKFFWAEQYMLDALLRGNPRYRLFLPLHQVYRERRDQLEALFPMLSAAGQRPSAYWIEVMAQDGADRA